MHGQSFEVFTISFRLVLSFSTFLTYLPLLIFLFFFSFSELSLVKFTMSFIQDTIFSWFESSKQRELNASQLFGLYFGEARTISPRTKEFMTKVYSLVGFTILAAVLGCALNFKLNWGGVISGVVEFFLIMLLISLPSTPKYALMRTASLLGSGFLTGFSLTPLVGYSYELDPRMIMTSFMSSLLIFAAFALVAWRTDTTKLLFIRSTLSSAVLGLLAFSFVRFFLPHYQFLSSIASVVSFALTCGFMLYHNAVLIHNSENNSNRDHVLGAMMLFQDFVTIFVKILSHLVQATAKENSKKEKRRAAARD